MLLGLEAEIDAERDPGLVFGARHNLARALMECGRPEEARELLRSNGFGDSGGRVNRLKVLWLEAQIDAALGDLLATALGSIDDGFVIMDDHGEVFASELPSVSPVLLSELALAGNRGAVG